MCERGVVVGRKAERQGGYGVISVKENEMRP